MPQALMNRVLWTRDQYYRMAEFGILPQGTRVELLEGDIVEKLPENRAHWLAVGMATTQLVRLFCDTHLVQVRLPLDLGERSQPVPDFALVPPEVAVRSERAPTDADLVIEISHASLDWKAAIYARARIRELWIVDLQSPRLLVLRDPNGQGYRSQQSIDPEDLVRPLFRPEVCVPLGCFFNPTA